MHGFEVGKTYTVPGRSKHGTLQRASGTPPPRDVPLGPSTTADQPITDASMRPQQGPLSWMISHSPPLDSLVLGPGHLSSSGAPRTIESHSPPAYLPAPQLHDPSPVPFSRRPPTYITTEMNPPQYNLSEFDPSLAQNVGERNLTDGDVEAIARRLMEMQRDQRS